MLGVLVRTPAQQGRTLTETGSAAISTRRLGGRSAIADRWTDGGVRADDAPNRPGTGRARPAAARTIPVSDVSSHVPHFEPASSATFTRPACCSGLASLASLSRREIAGVLRRAEGSRKRCGQSEATYPKPVPVGLGEGKAPDSLAQFPAATRLRSGPACVALWQCPRTCNSANPPCSTPMAHWRSRLPDLCTGFRLPERGPTPSP